MHLNLAICEHHDKRRGFGKRQYVRTENGGELQLTTSTATPREDGSSDAALRRPRAVYTTFPGAGEAVAQVFKPAVSPTSKSAA